VTTSLVGVLDVERDDAAHDFSRQSIAFHPRKPQIHAGAPACARRRAEQARRELDE